MEVVDSMKVIRNIRYKNRENIDVYLPSSSFLAKAASMFTYRRINYENKRLLHPVGQAVSL